MNWIDSDFLNSQGVEIYSASPNVQKKKKKRENTLVIRRNNAPKRWWSRHPRHVRPRRPSAEVVAAGPIDSSRWAAEASASDDGAAPMAAAAQHPDDGSSDPAE